MVLALCAGTALAQAPETSPRPAARPTASLANLQTADQTTRPPDRPSAVVQQVNPASSGTRRGSVCGVPEIQGEVVAAVEGSGDCGIAAPVQITSVSGVSLSTPSLMDCTTATALNDWVAQSASPRIGNRGGGLVSLRIAGSYVCRGRNNAAGARMSEHGLGRAIDVAGFGLRNGSEILVLTSWRRGAIGRRLRQMHDDACGVFKTVLGPESDAYHRDHFHLDTARGRSGAYCR